MPDKRDPMFRAVWLMLVILLIAVAGAAVNVVAYAATPPAPDGSRRAGPAEPQALALQRASNATVGVRALALEDAASNLALGRTRAGSGVVIDGDGVVLTIGYLIVEADRVELVLDDQRVVPARVRRATTSPPVSGCCRRWRRCGSRRCRSATRRRSRSASR